MCNKHNPGLHASDLDLHGPKVCSRVLIAFDRILMRNEIMKLHYINDYRIVYFNQILFIMEWNMEHTF